MSLTSGDRRPAPNSSQTRVSGLNLPRQRQQQKQRPLTPTAVAVTVALAAIASLCMSGGAGSGLLWAQTPAQAPTQAQAPRAAGTTTRDAQTALQLARTRLRLPAGLKAIQLRMRGTSFRREQAGRPDEAVARVIASQTVLLSREGRFRLQTDTLYPGGIRFRFLTVSSAEGSATIDELQWRNGIEIQRDPADAARTDFADLTFLAPALLFDAAFARDLAATPDPASAAHTLVAFADAAGRPTTMTIDRATGTVTSLRSGAQRYVYDDYRARHGVQQPSRIAVFTDERADATWAVAIEPARAAAARGGAAAGAGPFDLPAGYVEASSRGDLRATQIAPDTYRVDGTPSGYHTGFIVGTTSVALFDAPIGPDEAAQVKALIERTAPGRRLAFVVVSHGHRDHVAGLPVYLAAGAQVIVGANGVTALRRQLGAEAVAGVREATTSELLDLGGGAQVRLFPLASTHAADMLVAYAPTSRTIFQGDLFYLPEVGPTPAAFPVSRELAALIADHHLSVDHIVGVHGRTGTATDLAASLKLATAR